MPKNPPESMQRSLRQRLNEHAAARRPALAGIEVRYRVGFAYVDGRLPDGDVLKLCRLRFTGRLHIWGFAIWLASRDGYEENLLHRTPGRKPRGDGVAGRPKSCGGR